MSQSTATPAHGNSDILEYGPYSGWAFAAIALGLLSIAALAGPILWFIPIVAAIVALVALRKIKRADPPLSGRYLALLGLLMALFFAAAGPAHTVTRRYYLETRAVRFAGQFMQLLKQNRRLAAYQLTLPSGLRKPLMVDQTELDTKDPKTLAAYTTFQTEPLIKSLLESDDHVKIELASADLVGSEPGRDDVAVSYRLQFPADSAAKSTTVLLDVARTLSYTGHTEQWQIIPPG